MSKMTNLKKGVVGVCAATMLTGLCAGSAFGAVNAGAPGSFDAAGEGQTKVQATIDGTQVTATVPTTLPVVVVADGKFETALDAKVSNISNYNLHVKSIAVQPASGINLKASDYTLASGDTNIVKLSIKSATAGASDVDLGADAIAITSSQWNVAAKSDLGFTYSGSMQNVSEISTLPIDLLTVKWTIAVGNGA